MASSAYPEPRTALLGQRAHAVQVVEAPCALSKHARLCPLLLPRLRPQRPNCVPGLLAAVKSASQAAAPCRKQYKPQAAATLQQAIPPVTQLFSRAWGNHYVTQHPCRAQSVTTRSSCCRSSGHSHSAIPLNLEEGDPISWGQSISASQDEDDAASEHHHQSKVRNILEKGLRLLGLLQLAEALEERVWVSATITALFITAAASGFLPGAHAALAERARVAAIAAIYVLAGIPEFVELLFNLADGHIDTHVLMTLAVMGTLAIGSALEGALLLVLFQVSHTVEHELTTRAQGNLKSLFDRVPEHAVLVSLNEDGTPDIAGARSVAANDVEVGSLMLVRPGEQVALDGEVVQGEALVSTEHITGESLPARRRGGDEVPAGALNHDGLLVVRATRRAAQSTPARIARLTQHAQAKKPQLGRWLDSFGEVYSRGVIAAVIASFLGLLALGVPLASQGAQRGALYRALGLLTTASPCALVLVPLAYVSAIAAVTNRGILIKGGRVLDALVQCSTVAFDKTGTLTTGRLACTSLLPVEATPSTSYSNASSNGTHWARQVVERGTADDVHALASAVALSERATHPVSKAAAALGKEAGGQLPSLHIEDFKLVPGAGVQGSTIRDGQKRALRFGSVEFAVQGLSPSQAAAAGSAASLLATDSVVSLLVDTAVDAGGAVASANGIGNRPANGNSAQWDLASPSGKESVIRMFTFSDTVHVRSATAIARLQNGSWKGQLSPEDALRVIMLTGDNAANAMRVGRALGISHVQAGLSPEQKLDAVARAREAQHNSARGKGVIMVGDGLNDAPALASAEVGVAVAATPTEAAAAAADVLLLTGNGIAALPFLLHTAHRTQAIIKQNLALAVGAMLALSLPVLCGTIPLWVAVALHEGSTVLVALNSLRLLYMNNDKALRGASSDAEVSFA